MSLVSLLDLDNVPDQAPVEAGEYELKILSCEVQESKKDPSKENIVAVMEILGQPNASNIFRYLALPHASDDEKTSLAKRRFAKEFFQAFGATPDEVGTDSIKGKTAWALLSVREYEGREMNEIKKFILPAN